MSDKERKLYDQKIYANLNEQQLENKRQRQKQYYSRNKN